MDKSKQSKNQRMSPPDSINGFEVDPVANLIPMMTEEEFSGFYEQIVRDSRVFTPVVLRNGRIVEGRHRMLAAVRYRAQHQSDLAVPTRDFDESVDGELAEFVKRENLPHRNLSEDQRIIATIDLYRHGLVQAATVARAATQFGGVGRIRDQAGVGKGGVDVEAGSGQEPTPVTVPQKSGEPVIPKKNVKNSGKNPTAESLALLAGVSRNKIDAATKLAKSDSPDALNRIRSGESTIKAEVAKLAVAVAVGPKSSSRPAPSLKDRVRKAFLRLKKEFGSGEWSEALAILRSAIADEAGVAQGVCTPKKGVSKIKLRRRVLSVTPTK